MRTPINALLAQLSELIRLATNDLNAQNYGLCRTSLGVMSSRIAELKLKGHLEEAE